MPTSINHFAKCAAGFFLLSLVLCGCETVRDYSVTYKVWNNEEWRHFAGPAPDPHLALFETANANDILVQYDEMSDTSGRIRRRGYFLYPNLKRVQENKRPDFVKPALASGLKPIELQDSPLSTTDPHPMPGFYAVIARGGREFTLYRPGGTEGPYELPDYLKSNRTAARVLLTPLAVAADSVMVGLVASVVGAYMLAKGQYGGKCSLSSNAQVNDPEILLLLRGVNADILPAARGEGWGEGDSRRHRYTLVRGRNR